MQCGSFTSISSDICTLPNAEYNHRITDFRKKILCLSSQPREWIQAIFTEWLGIQTPHAWQIENTLDLCEGVDVFITAKTGSRKSALTLTPVIACCLKIEPHIAIVVYPTEALMSDQVSCTIVIHALTWRCMLYLGREGTEQGGLLYCH